MFFEKLTEIANNNELKASAKSINQTQRNQLNAELTMALLKMLVGDSQADSGVFSINDVVSVGQIDSKTIEFALDNAKVGIIPIRISISIPNFDTDLDLYSRVEEYQMAIEEKASKLAEKEELKQAKIKADNERRAKQKALREQAENK